MAAERASPNPGACLPATLHPAWPPPGRPVPPSSLGVGAQQLGLASEGGWRRGPLDSRVCGEVGEGIRALRGTSRAQVQTDGGYPECSRQGDLAEGTAGEKRVQGKRQGLGKAEGERKCLMQGVERTGANPSVEGRQGEEGGVERDQKGSHPEAGSRWGLEERLLGDVSL